MSLVYLTRINKHVSELQLKLVIDELKSHLSGMPLEVSFRLGSVSNLDKKSQTIIILDGRDP
jgi:hypothetical protein